MVDRLGEVITAVLIVILGSADQVFGQLKYFFILFWILPLLSFTIDNTEDV